MKCPHCQNEITKDDIKSLSVEDRKKLRAVINGTISSRVLTPEQAKKMVEAREAKRK